LRLVEAVALSLGYEPGQPALVALHEYRERLEVAIRCFGQPHRSPDQDWGGLVVEKARFAEWAHTVDLKVPPELMHAENKPSDAYVTEKMVRELQEAFDRVDRPSQREVAARAGYDRNSKAFKAGWARLKKKSE
jgi:hypothetical protein